MVVGEEVEDDCVKQSYLVILIHKYVINTDNYFRIFQEGRWLEVFDCSHLNVPN
jgi:hypothetical protein